MELRHERWVGARHHKTPPVNPSLTVNRRSDAGGGRQSDADPAVGVAVVGNGQDMAVSWGGRGASLAR